MFRRFACLAVLSMVPACTVFADFTYEQTTTITGGAAMAMMRTAGAFSKQAREPIKTTVMVKGNRMVHATANRLSIIDVDKETITDVDLQKKQYSVMTFAEMKQFLEEMSQRMKSGDGAEAKWKVSGSATGNTRKIDGLDAKEFVMTMEMEMQNAQKGQSGAMNITTHTWLASGVAGYDEVRAFHKRMGEKLAWNPGGGMMMNRPDIARGMAQVAKEMAALDGIPVLQLVKMGGAAGAGSPQNAQLTPEQQAQVAAAQQQADQARAQGAQQQPAQEQPSAGSVLGGALGGRLGRFGGLGRKKPAKDDQPQQQQQSQQTPAAAAGAAPPSDPSALMETSTELTNFASGPVDGSKFEVPAGFKQVESEMKRRSR